MRRLIAIGLAFVALAALVATSASGQDEGDSDGASGDYKVRAYFDNAGFLVNGEEVRVAGANVGVVEEVTVSLPGEAVREDGAEEPGKAVAVLDITNPGFQNFLTDASCMIRPQSLLGEKFVECTPTQPRAPGSEAPPSLTQIPDGEIGEGQYILPLENNGKQVDLDLVNNITGEPEADRFRLIINDLGAALAARGPDLAEVIERANPALKQTDIVLKTLAKQNKQLAQLAVDSDRVLTPLEREKERLAGFIRNAAIAGTAAGERRDDIVASFNEFPEALRQLQSTMVELQGFADTATPVAIDLRRAAPGLTGATKALQPFSRAATISISNLGDNTEAASDDLAGSSPVVRQLGKVGQTAIPGTRNLNLTLNTLRRTGGIDHLMDFIINNGNAFNGFDQYGHYLRTQLQTINCVEYETAPTTGCDARWFGNRSGAAALAEDQRTTLSQLLEGGATLSATGEYIPGEEASGGVAVEPTAPEPETQPSPDGEGDGSTAAATAADASRGTKDLLEFLIGDGQ